MPHADEDDIVDVFDDADPGLTQEVDDPADAPPDDDIELDESQESDPADLPGDDPAESGKPHGVQKRIKELVRDREVYRERGDHFEQQLAEARERLKALETPAEPEIKPPARPNPVDFDDDYAFQEAALDYAEKMADFKAEQKSRDLRHRSEQEKAESQVKQAKQQIQESWNAKVKEYQQEKPDFVEKITSPYVRCTQNMLDTMMELERGPEVAYYLAENPEKAARISDMSNKQQDIALGAVESQLAAGTGVSRKVTQAPPPTRSTGPTRKAPSKDPAKMSLSEYAAWRQSGGGK